MNATRLVCISPVIAACLLIPEVALAQTSPTSASDVQPSSLPGYESMPSANAEPLRMPMLLEPYPLVQRNAPGPWVSTMLSDPRYLRGPALQVQSGPYAPPPGYGPPPGAYAPQQLVDREMESRFVARRTVGGVLLGLSSPFLVSGGYLISEFSGIGGGAYGVGYLVGGFGVAVGVLSGLLGVGLFIPGLIYAVTDPPKPGVASTRLRPKVHVNPGGVGLSMSF